MRLLLRLLFFMVCFSSNAQQYAAEDAQLIGNELITVSAGSFSFKTDPVSVTELCKILRNYLPTSDRGSTTITENQVLDKFKDNPFFGNEIKPLIQSAPGVRSIAGNRIAGFYEKNGISFPNIDVTNFADGLAKFLVARTKEELNVAFFRKFKQFIDKYPEAQILFPNTYTFVGQIHSQHYTAMLPALKTAFNKDFSAFNSNLLKLRGLTKTDCKNNKECEDRMKNLNEFLTTKEGRGVVACLLISDNIMAGYNAPDVIANLAADPLFSNLAANDDNLANIVHFVNLMSQSLRSREAGKVWIDPNQARTMMANVFQFKIYMGLLYETSLSYTINGHPIQFKFDTNPVALKNILKYLGDNWPALSPGFTAQFKRLADAAALVSSKTKELNNTADDDIETYIIQYSQYANTLSDFLKVSFGFLEANGAVDSRLPQLKADIERVITLLDATTGIAYDIKSKSYNALVVDTSLFLSALFNDDFKYKDSFIKYATFMANVTEAKDSDEVNRAIEAAVLPVGSSSVKRESQVNIAINAYLGAFGGWETMPALAENKTAGSVGLLAPVGVAFSKGNLFKCKDNPDSGGKAITLFLSLIDVGALASYRFDDSQTNIASDIKLENIVAPGLFLYYGFGKCPISIGGGVQFTPQLRGITETAEATISEAESLSIRYGFSVVVDIPLFNLFTKTQ